MAESIKDRTETDSGNSRKVWTKEEADRLFEKQAKYEEECEEASKKHLDWCRKNQEERNRIYGRDLTKDPLVKDRDQREYHKIRVVRAWEDACRTQKFLYKKDVAHYREILKKGVLEGAIEIHEISTGFMIDTPDEKVNKYVRQYLARKGMLPTPRDLVEGYFLLGTVDDLLKLRVKHIRNSLMGEFQAKTPSDFMLIDLAASNYLRAMYATKREMNSLWYAKEDEMEMFTVMKDGLQPYIHACQNQFLRVLIALRGRRQATSTFSYETYSRTDINLEAWGIPLLRALADITEKKQEQIDIDEIKAAMSKHLDGTDAETIPNSAIGYALIDYGFTSRIHVYEGNRYNISRDKVLRLLSNEELKT